MSTGSAGASLRAAREASIIPSRCVILSATAAGIVATSEIIFAFVTAWLWLQEALNTWQVIGATVVFGGIVIAQTARTSDVVVQADLALETGPIILPVDFSEDDTKANYARPSPDG